MKLLLLLVLVAYSTAVPISLKSAVKPKTVEWTSLHEARHSNGLGDIWSSCSKSGDPFEINKVTITPDPPVKGQGLTVVANITFDESVTKGNIKVSVKYGFLPIYSGTFDLCTELSAVGIKCPTAKGPQILKHSVTIPSEVPSGHYTGNAEVTDQNGNELVCVNFDLHL